MASISGRDRSGRGQSLVEFAIILPILMLILGGIIQFGMLFWAQNTLTQVARDTGRWASSQTTACTSATNVQAQASAIAANSSLLSYPTYPVTATVSWTKESGPDLCPPPTNQTVWYVNISLSHQVPQFIPFLNVLLSQCGGGTCTLTTSAQFRMEPKPGP